MKYIIFLNEEISQDMLDAAAAGGVTTPSPIWMVDPDLETSEPGTASAYSYISTNTDYPNGFEGFLKLSSSEFEAAKISIKASEAFVHKSQQAQSVKVTEQIAPPPFSSKEVSGKKLYTRTHGQSFAVTTGSNTCDFRVPYPSVKFNALEIVGCEFGDNVSLQVLDTSTGTISTVPDYLLNQFGFTVGLPDNFYSRESQYDADLIYDMAIRIVYVSSSDKTITVNYVLHELKD